MDPQQGPPQPDFLIGQTIGNYRVTEKLGEGGMGSVYLAEHPAIGKKVALKVLHSEFSNNQDVATRFFNEARAVNDIGHPNIVDIVDFGILQAGGGRDQLVYFIMEYLAGATLSQLIRNEAPLPPERALTIGLQVADALAASHKCGIVHRDLKPDNIILLQRGRERDFVKLLDFGIAKLTGGSAMGSHRTRTGIVMGTPAYMSPEQCEGRDSVDLRTDIYALGIVMYEMLTGRVPFLGEGYGEILVQHLTQRPAPVSQFRMLPPHVESVVMKALEKRADLRYPNMEEFMRAMADPVGYVEAHGGVAGFGQRQLMPSSAPIPASVRLTPAPLTPSPGLMSPPSFTTPVPTTMSSATGATASSSVIQGGTGRNRTGYFVAGGLVVAAAAIAIIIVATGGKEVSPAGGGSAASGSAVVAGSGSSVSSGNAAAPDSAGAGSGSAVAAGTGSGSSASETGSAGSGSAVAAGTGSGSALAPTIPDSGSAGAGSAGSGATVAVDNVEIQIISTPPGAKIVVDGTDTNKLTPSTLSLPKGNSKVQISLRLKGYMWTGSRVDTSASSEQRYELTKAKPVQTGQGSGTGSSHPTTPTGTTKPTTNNSDPDGLMRP